MPQEKTSWMCKALLAALIAGISFMIYHFIVDPFTTARIEAQSSWVQQDLGVIHTDLPFVLKEHIFQEQKNMLCQLFQVFNEQDVIYWPTQQTLLHIFQFQKLAPWQDYISISIMFNCKNKIPTIRNRLTQLQHKKNDYVLEKNLATGAYYYKKNNFAGFPVIDIDIMEEYENKVQFCTPTDEIGNCSFSDSRERLNEVCDQEIIFPLQQINFETMTITIPHNPQAYLTNVFGINWKRSNFRSGIIEQHICNRASRNLHDILTLKKRLVFL